MRYRHRGFSLIEMMITITIMAILLSLGAPAFSAFLANLRIRTTAEGFLSGLQLARADAVQRNANVQFVLTNDVPIAANLVTAAANANGINWMIRTADTTTFIEGKSGAEGGSSNSPVEVAGNVSSVTFTGLGNTTLVNTATFQFTNSTAGSCITPGGHAGVRCLNVMVATGGRIRLCDPSVTAAGDSRGC